MDNARIDINYFHPIFNVFVDLYARVATVEKSAITSPMTLKAAFDYSSQGDEELSLIKGDIVEVR